MLTLEELKKLVLEGSIDTVVVSIPDMQGRLMGKRFHAKHFIESAYDEIGNVGIDFGVYGVPETFVLDKKGIIRYKHIGPIDEKQLADTIIPLVAKLEEEVMP